MYVRNPHNPLITPRSITASRPDFEVLGTFNAGVTTFRDEVIMLVRVAERPLQTKSDCVRYPEMLPNGEIVVREVSRSDDQIDVHDPRLIIHRRTGKITLTSMSHLRLARSRDGVTFTVDSQPWLTAQPPHETFGVEDARITQIEGTYYVNYSAVSPLGISTALISTPDFVQIKREGIIFPPSNRDVTLFPERVNGLYVAYHRPMPALLGSLNIWCATSPDLVHWGNHQVVFTSSEQGWDAGRVGGGAPPIRTSQGWLSIYHAADPRDRYCLGAFLTPLDEPQRVIGRSRTPILAPEAVYETSGFFPNVVFTCGAILEGDTLKVYYGASDEVMALVSIPLADVFASLSE